MLTVVPDSCPGHEGRKDASPSLIDEIVREGARRMLAKPIEAAQDRWRAVNAPHLVALVRAGARFERGVLVEREAAA